MEQAVLLQQVFDLMKDLIEWNVAEVLLMQNNLWRALYQVSGYKVIYQTASTSHRIRCPLCAYRSSFMYISFDERFCTKCQLVYPPTSYVIVRGYEDLIDWIARNIRVYELLKF